VPMQQGQDTVQGRGLQAYLAHTNLPPTGPYIKYSRHLPRILGWSEAGWQFIVPLVASRLKRSYGGRCEAGWPSHAILSKYLIIFLGRDHFLSFHNQASTPQRAMHGDHTGLPRSQQTAPPPGPP